MNSIVNLYIIKNILKLKKDSTRKKPFNVFIHHCYKKDGNYYPKVFLEKFIHDFSWRNIANFGFWGWKFLLKYKKIPFPEV